MKVTLVRIWASPSTLHLRVMVTAKNGSWSVFRDLHIAKEELPIDQLQDLIHSGLVDELEPSVEPGLF